MKSVQKCYVDHVAIRVSDINWHIGFFCNALGMEIRKIQGAADRPDQCSMFEGIQLISDPERDLNKKSDGPDHIGIMVEDVDAAIDNAKKMGVESSAKAVNWLEMPHGLILELMQAKPASAVRQILAVNARSK
jgi:catechol 2,3-dioxygenase-like lactoylglutathione lyase family enzyme